MHRSMLRPLNTAVCSTARRTFATSKTSPKELRIGYVPEHFSTPLHFAKKHYALNGTLVPFPSGTGAMIQSLKSSDIDVGIGLTEGWVAGLAKESKAEKQPYQLVGTYVETPLCWAISTGSKREIKGVQELRGKKIGVSRIGSGSYVMGFVLADKNGWLEKKIGGESNSPFEPVVLNTFANLRAAVDSGEVDFFMWEHFTSKRYYDNGEIARVGEIYTPWSSWKIVARDPQDGDLQTMADAINQGVQHFRGNEDEAIEYISQELDYSKEDATEWMKTVRFADNVRGVDPSIIDKTIEILGKAGVLDAKTVKSDDMIAIKRAEKAQAS